MPDSGAYGQADCCDGENCSCTRDQYNQSKSTEDGRAAQNCEGTKDRCYPESRETTAPLRAKVGVRASSRAGIKPTGYQAQRNPGQPKL